MLITLNMLPAIRVENLGKEFHIGAELAAYATLSEAIVNTVTAPARSLRSLAKGEPIRKRNQSFWALRGINFEVQPGEVVGIIGRNGAGKSTLLKILSRITEPSEGYVDMRGRVGSLLEVGTGFHPELTGRENIFLSGAILGMRRAEIARKFDEIVEFAEIGKFLDTPVKRYSSGMYIRLGFGIAAHLEPEILVVDEVLAVGDTSFQKKCLNKMEEVGHQGRTVLFVSHNMTTVTRLCPRVILLDKGSVLSDGPSTQVVGAYLQSNIGTSAAREWSADEAPGNHVARLRAIRVRDDQGRVSEALDIRQPIAIEMEFEVTQAGHVLVPNLHFYNEEGLCVFVTADHDPEWHRKPRPEGCYRSAAHIPGNLLAEGMLVVHTALSTMDPVTIHFVEQEAVAFQIVDSIDGDSARGDFGGAIPGVFRPLLKWTNEVIKAPTSARDQIQQDANGVVASLR